jgi:hypothetical protein
LVVAVFCALIGAFLSASSCLPTPVLCRPRRRPPTHRTHTLGTSGEVCVQAILEDLAVLSAGKQLRLLAILSA